MTKINMDICVEDMLNSLNIEQDRFHKQIYDDLIYQAESVCKERGLKVNLENRNKILKEYMPIGEFPNEFTRFIEHSIVNYTLNQIKTDIFRKEFLIIKYER